ncbi:MAG: histidine phosphotransferase [Proteobacteria bacterium]|nr:histidine phosphotransferase [Pseudomonadota bacterium]
MSQPIELHALDLAALLCSRVCHDLISPVGAIANGLEVLDDAKDAETRTFALDLIKKSAHQGSARLQFCRIAFGAAGSPTSPVDLGEAEKVARGLLEHEKTKLTWGLPREMVAKNRVKLLLNMLLIATQTIPRGGNLTVEAIGAGDAMTFRIVAAGLNARVPQAIAGLLAGGSPGESIDAHAIQPFYTGLLARSCGLAVTIGMDGDAVAVSAQ